MKTILHKCFYIFFNLKIEWNNIILIILHPELFFTLLSGYNRVSHSSEAASIGYWSDGSRTSVDVGVWGHREPVVANGDCAYISMTTGLWHMTSCEDILPFVCQLNPCPGTLCVNFFFGRGEIGRASCRERVCLGV